MFNLFTSHNQCPKYKILLILLNHNDSKRNVVPLKMLIKRSLICCSRRLSSLAARRRHRTVWSWNRPTSKNWRRPAENENLLARPHRLAGRPLPPENHSALAWLRNSTPGSRRRIPDTGVRGPFINSVFVIKILIETNTFNTGSCSKK